VDARIRPLQGAIPPLELEVVQRVVLLLGDHDSDGLTVALDDHGLAPRRLQQLPEAGFGVVGGNIGNFSITRGKQPEPLSKSMFFKGQPVSVP